MVVLAAALCLALLVAGMSSSIDDAETTSEHIARQAFNAELASAYVDAGCWRCHSITTLESELTDNFGVQAAGARNVGPDLAGVGARFHREWHTAHFWRPEWAYSGSQMPAQRQLFEQDADGTPKLNERGEKVVRFLASLTKPSEVNQAWGTRPVAAPAGYHVSGRTLYLRECASCHGNQGAGDGPASVFFLATRKPANLAKGEILRRYDFPRYRDSVYTTITNGVPLTGMPAFGNRLSDQERADIAAYLARLADKE